MMVLREGRIEAFGPKEEILRGQIASASPGQAAAAPAFIGKPASARPASGPAIARIKDHGTG
jgi:hypothetical protein